jgi:hypothetical protein
LASAPRLPGRLLFALFAAVLAQPTDEPSDHQRGQPERDDHARADEHIGENYSGAALDGHDARRRFASMPLYGQWSGSPRRFNALSSFNVRLDSPAPSAIGSDREGFRAQAVQASELTGRTGRLTSGQGWPWIATAPIDTREEIYSGECASAIASASAATLQSEGRSCGGFATPRKSSA